MEPRRFPPPWTVQCNGDAYWVEDASGHRFAFCYFRENGSIGGGRQAYLTQDQARQIAVNVAKLPELIEARHPNHWRVARDRISSNDGQN